MGHLESLRALAPPSPAPTQKPLHEGLVLDALEKQASLGSSPCEPLLGSTHTGGTILSTRDGIGSRGLSQALPFIWEVVTTGVWAVNTGCHALWQPLSGGWLEHLEFASEHSSLVGGTRRGHTRDKSGSVACSSVQSVIFVFKVLFISEGSE